MSHFTVLVIGEDVEKQLEPFWELDLSEDELKDDLRSVFNDITEDELEKYNTKTITQVITPDGRMLFPWDDKFRVKDKKGIGTTTKVPEDLEQREVPFNEKYKTFEEYMTDYHNMSPNENGRYGYYNNPKAKWDWYSIGGRWSGFFKLKKGCSGELGRPGVFENKPKVGYVDQAYKRDIDFEGMRADHIVERSIVYDKFHNILKGREIPNWNKILEECNQKLDEARKIYNNNPVIIDIQKEGFWLMNIEYFCVPKEKFIENESKNAISTYAVVYNGEWYEKGEMGWWGISTNEKEPDKWNVEFNKLLDSVPDDTLLTLVDCHI